MGEGIRAACVDFNGDCWTGLPRQAYAGARIPTRTWPGSETWLSTRFNRHYGHAWCKGAAAPRTPGQAGDLIGDLTRQGHDEGMRMMGYFIIDVKGSWAAQHPDPRHARRWNRWHILLSAADLDYLTASVTDALAAVPVNRFILDMWWNVDPVGLPCEWKVYQALMGHADPPPPDQPAFPSDVVAAFNRAAADRVWQRIAEVARSANPDCLIWLSVNNVMNVRLDGTTLPGDVNWLMNESFSPDAELAQTRRVSALSAQVWQCVCGMEGRETHNPEGLLAALPEDVGSCRGAAAIPSATLTSDDHAVTAQHRRDAALLSLRLGRLHDGPALAESQ